MRNFFRLHYDEVLVWIALVIAAYTAFYFMAKAPEIWYQR